MYRSLSDSILFYCGKAGFGHFFRFSSSNSGLFSSKNRKNCLKPDFPSLRTIKSDRLLVIFWLAFVLPASAFALDPTRPPVAFATATAERQAPAALRLQAIVRNGQVARAVVNGASLRVGDSLADARVLAINPHSVLIERDGQRQLLRLAAPVITPSKSTP